MKRQFAIATLAAATAVAGVSAGPVNANVDELSKLQVKQLLIERALAHEISTDMILCVVEKESRFVPSARGSRGEYGLAQWLPGRKNAWDYTLAYAQGIDIVKAYDSGDANAVYFDADGLADLLARGRAYRHKHWPITILGCE